MKFVVILVSILILIVVVFAVLGWYSSRLTPKTMTNETVLQCGEKPNCVSSQRVSKPSQLVEPILVSGNKPVDDLVVEAVEATGGKLVSADSTLIVATYQSKMFRFIDDVVVKINPAPGRHIDIMSSSRVGHSDFNANRHRVEQLRQILTVPADQ